MTLVDLIAFEEGWRSKPYLCSEGYPTVGFGFKIGPKGADLGNYQFVLPRCAGNAWLMQYVEKLHRDMRKSDRICAAVGACCPARSAVLASMAYQMGAHGLDQFRNALAAVADRRFDDAASEMLDSRWARQTPERAARHAEQMRTGVWCSEYEGALNESD